MSYTIAIERFASNGDDECEIEIVEREINLALETALDKLKQFVLNHPNGYLLEGSAHPIEYETDGAELSFWVDFDMNISNS